MNYSRVHGLSLCGFQGVPVEIECVQSRRLPFVQILGAAPGPAAELRERISTAIEASGFRLPGRKVTVRLQPALHSLPLENLDLAVALAVLAAAGRLPASRLENSLVSGSLALNGRIVPIGGELAATRQFFAKNFAMALVPWAESAWMADENVPGGGFSTLAEVVAYLSGQSGSKFAKSETKAGVESSFSLNPRLVRALELMAAGGHHGILFSLPSTEAQLASAALASLLPMVSAEERREAWALARLRGTPSAVRRFHPTAKAEHPFVDACLARHGILTLDQATEHESAALAPLLLAMRNGRMQWSRGAHQFAEDFRALVLASAPICACGADPRCLCRVPERQWHRKKVEKLLLAPFDLRFSINAAAGPEPSPWPQIRNRIKSARERMLARGGEPNARLNRALALSAKPWRESALRAYEALITEGGCDQRAQAALARLALTVSDLRDAVEVTEQDLLEAHHYSCGPGAGAGV